MKNFKKTISLILAVCMIASRHFRFRCQYR